ncbi:MAG: transglycosylase SLT domain-containing protein [archaeon]
MFDKIVKLVVFFIAVILLVQMGSAYYRSNTAYTSYGVGTGLFSSQGYSAQDREQCEQGQDFILQISPFGCAPPVVRTDLLEDQDVQVFCQLSATKINPLIDVEAIEYISFKGDKPKEIKYVGYQPSRAALSRNQEVVNSPILDNIGSVVFVLDRQRNSSAIPDFIEGTVTATLKYDIENAFGIGKASFYLPMMDENEWEEKYLQYSFWNGKGYIRAEDVSNDQAVISLYNDNRKLHTFNLEKGEESNMVPLPGFACDAGLTVKLNNLETPDTRARLNIDGQIIEVKDEEKFLDEGCKVTDLRKEGLFEEVSIKCGRESFKLNIAPKINVTINGKEKELSVGDVLYDFPDHEKKLFLGYVGEINGVTFMVPVVSPAKTSFEFLDSFTAKQLPGFVRVMVSQTGSSVLDFVKTVAGVYGGLFNFGVAGITGSYPIGIYPVEGEELTFLQERFNGAITSAKGFDLSLLDGIPEIKFNGFANPSDFDLKGKAREYYDKAIQDYDLVLSDFSNTKYGSEKTKGEQALIGKIELASKTGQMASILRMCEAFKRDYPDSDFNIKEYCDNKMRLASNSVTNRYVEVNGVVREITFEGIYEPSEKDFSAEIFLSGAGEYSGLKTLGKNQDFYLGESVADLDENYVEKIVEEKFGKICSKYTKEVLSVANKHNIDPLLLFAVMKQESQCDPNAYNENKNEKGEITSIDSGLMMINSQHCGPYKLGNRDDCVKRLKENPDLNIQIGAEILRKAYTDYGISSKKEVYKGKVEFHCTDDKYKGTYLSYEEWSAALRAYNGFSCTSGDVEYVEHIAFYYDQVGGSLPKGISTKETVSGISKDVARLIELDDEWAIFDISGVYGEEGNLGFNYEDFTRFEGSDSSLGYGKLKVRLGETKRFGKNDVYSINVNKINLNKVALATIDPNIRNYGTEANFSFKIGVEKRAIQLSPEKIKNKIDTLNKSILEWQDRVNKLGKVVKGLKAACFGVNAVLTFKNLISNTGGKSIARQEVMRGEGGWYDRCAELVQEKVYRSIEKCLSDKSGEINDAVNARYNALRSQNDEIKRLQELNKKKDVYGNEVYDTESFEKDYLDNIKEDLEINLKAKLGNNYKIEDKSISEFVRDLDSKNIPFEDIRELELNSMINDQGSAEMIKEKLESNVEEIYGNTKAINRLSELKKQTEETGMKGASFIYSVTKDTREEAYDGFTTNAVTDFGDIKGEKNIQGYINDNGKEYYLELEKMEGSEDKHKVINVYDLKGKEVTNTSFQNSLFFIHYNDDSYKNQYKISSGESKPILRYYETEPYKGLPAIVPFDLKEGWYVSMRQTLPVFGSIRAYDDSGRVNSFYLCNVGEGGKEENRGGNDICEMINTGTGMPYNQFPGLSTTKASKLISDAKMAIEQASRQYKSGVRNVEINIPGRGRFSVDVGSPAVDIPDMQCQDFMSPSECKLLFNVCDPVICPSSRCDLGGAYPVKDVVQSGVAGSLFLCLPNFPEVYVPICLSGVNAGIEGLLSVQKSYRDCLQTSLETGEQIGICDELHSIYLCEALWRQGIPLAKLGLPKLLEVFSGQSSRGGGEYLGAQTAWSNAEQSMQYFTQYYAENAFNAFKARSTEEAGGEICKVAVSGVIPVDGTMLDLLTEPDSPTQLHGRFDEIPYTTATNPPISHYKVFYHIYAGNDRGAYWKVYLKGSSESSFYQDTSASRFVGSGYVSKGDYVSETIDFTAPSGYKELCIMVNEQEECGFRQVSTDFAVNYITDKYLQEQANKTDIKSESECISGSTSVYSLLNPNLQEGIGGLANPSISGHQLIRTCATQNPGLGSDGLANMDGSRWVPVGYCGDENMKCWLDTKSVEKAIKNLDIEEQVLKNQNENSQKVLESEGDYIQDFAGELQKIPKTPLEAIEFITEIIKKAFWNHEKAHLLWLRGNEYSGLAINETDRLRKSLEPPLSECDPPCSEVEECINGECFDTGKLTYEEEWAGRSVLDPDKRIVFEFSRGFFEETLSFYYFEGDWYFSRDDESFNIDIISAFIKQNEIPELENRVVSEEELKKIIEDMSSDFYSSSNFVPSDAYSSYSATPGVYVFGLLSEEEQNIILDIANKNYNGGVDVLIEKVIDIRGSKLSTEKVDFENREEINLFTVRQPDKLSYIIYFRYRDGEWEWAPTNKEFWLSIKDYDSFPESNFKKYFVNTFTKRIFFALQQANSEEEGSRILFQVNLDDSFVDISVFENIEDENIQEDVRNELTCESCGSDEDWYTSILGGWGDICDEDQCNALNDMLIEIDCEYSEFGGDWLSWILPGGSCETKEVSMDYREDSEKELDEKKEELEAMGIGDDEGDEFVIPQEIVSSPNAQILSPIFEVEGGREELFYRFTSEGWQWSDDKEKWIDASTPYTTSTRYTTSGGYQLFELEEENKELLGRLDNVNTYERGFGVLEDRIMSTADDGKSDEELTSGQVKYYYDSNQNLYQYGLITLVYSVYDNVWKWKHNSFDFYDSVWRSVDDERVHFEKYFNSEAYYEEQEGEITRKWGIDPVPFEILKEVDSRLEGAQLLFNTQFSS